MVDAGVYLSADWAKQMPRGGWPRALQSSTAIRQRSRTHALEAGLAGSVAMPRAILPGLAQWTKTSTMPNDAGRIAIAPLRRTSSVPNGPICVLTPVRNLGDCWLRADFLDGSSGLVGLIEAGVYSLSLAEAKLGQSLGRHAYLQCHEFMNYEHPGLGRVEVCSSSGSVSFV